MLITGSSIMVRSGTDIVVEQKLVAFPEVTFHGKSDSGMDLIVNLEAESQDELEKLCEIIKDSIPEIIDIGHIYINFEDEIARMQSESI